MSANSGNDTFTDSVKIAHTPGPWRIGDAGYTVFGPPNGSPSPKTIANIPFKAGDGKANARLIAAAPDLLAALEEVAALDDGDVPALWTFAATFDRCRAAIAKARGA